MDPAEVDSEAEIEVTQNVFDGLWRFDHNLHVVADIATAVPTVANGGLSADGLTYRVHLNHGARFANGDPVTSANVLYSWNRAVAKQGAYAGIFAGIEGYADVQQNAGAAPDRGSVTRLGFLANIERQLAAHNPAFMMRGLTAPDAHTVAIKLGRPCGWCLSAWALGGASGSVVDARIVGRDPMTWWSSPGVLAASTGLIGTGPFYLTSYVPKERIQFRAVANWWGEPKPVLTAIDVDIKDPTEESTAIAAWAQGAYDIVGYVASSDLPVADILRIKSDSQESSQLLLVPKGRTTWISPNIGNAATGGPFVGESVAAVGLRRAFALAIDVKGLAATVCKDVLCVPATGGVITRGLIGNLGDGKDPLATYDPPRARALLHQYDPTGSLTRHLTYSFDVGGMNDPVASYLQGEWQKNLGVTVTIDPHADVNAFIGDRLSGKYVLARDGWQFDYNHPQDWFDNLWGALAAGANSSGFADPTEDPGPDEAAYNQILTRADGLPIDQALPLYTQLSQLLIKDVVYFPLYYSVGQFLIHSYVLGAGSSTQGDYLWNGITLRSH